MPLWPIPEIEVQENTLDFTSSGQSVHTFHSVHYKEDCLINAVELLSFETHCVQLLVCQACGVTGCEPGCWVSLRRYENRILFLPALTLMCEGDWEREEYSPPKFLVRRGIPCFGRDVYEQFWEKAGRFPEPQSIPALTNLDLVGLLQLSAPSSLLGRLGAPPVLDSKPLVAVSDGDLDRELEVFRILVNTLQGNEDGIPVGSPSRVVTFYSDLPGLPEWSPFGYDKDLLVVNAGEILGGTTNRGEA